ncbi:MAG: carboxymuconolactone decarboxylase family protein [Pseudonocardiaceae bacterium]
MPHAASPRVPPLELEEMDEEQRKLSRLGADTVIQVLARNPELMTAFQPLGGFLLSQGKLDPRIRELAILRVALRCDAPYEWANHVPAALGGGATEAEIDALSDPAASWEPTDDAVLRAVDEVCADVYVSDETWAALTATRDYPEIIELLFLIGFYRMMAGFLNSAGVQVKAGMPALGQHAGSQPASTTHFTGTVRVSSGTTGADGTWNITFEHPAGNKDLVLTLKTADTIVTGWIFDTLLDTTVPIVAGMIDGKHLAFTAQVTDPARFDIGVEGMIDGDSFTGKVTISGGGTFPFSGTRATLPREQP